jgi:hypothetical protein
MRPLFPTVSPSKRCLCPQRLSILHSLRSSYPKSAKSAPLFSITCALFFTLCKRTTRHLASFQSLPHSLQEYPGGRPRQNTFISQPPPATRAFREAQQPTKPANWNRPLFGVHFVFISSHPYFRRSAEKPYPTPYHLMAKRYRTHPRSVGVYSGSRDCFRCPGLKWSAGFRVCTCKP